MSRRSDIQYLRERRRVASVNTRDVPVAVRDAFKAYCAARGYTMQAAVIALMMQAADEDLVLPAARKVRK